MVAILGFMVSQNTVAREELTNGDKAALQICEKLAATLKGLIGTPKEREIFERDYARIHFSRDAGQGRGAGKLQRDALCTRGRQAKAPFSNRNLRWHPLVLSVTCPNGFTEMNIDVDSKKKLLRFIPVDEPEKTYLPTEVHTLKKPYCVTAKAWIKHVDEVRKWSQDDWIRNWCAIPLIEYSPVEYSIECFAVLGMSVAVALFNADLDSVYDAVLQTFKKYGFKKTEYFPPKSVDLIKCPVCNSLIKEYPARLIPRQRPAIWNPPWQKSKREEGEDQSIQLMHVEPLVESKINHNASNVRYGHRWCNVAMSDHSVAYLKTWMKKIISTEK